MRRVKDHWDDWAVKNVWPQIKFNKLIREYLPYQEMLQGRFPDKEFFWGVLFTVVPTWANAYYKAVIKKRLATKKNTLKEIKTINISAKWEAALQEHDFISKCKFKYRYTI